MTQQLLQGSTEITIDSLRTLKIEYFITEQPEFRSEKTYGILIKKYSTANNILKFEEDASISLTNSFEEVKRVCQILINNKVTPISLSDIIEDMYYSEQPERILANVN